MSRASQPIELLHVADQPEEKSLARGLSIKLLPVEEDLTSTSNPPTTCSPARQNPSGIEAQDSFKSMSSTSSMCSLEIPIPPQMKKLEELCDAHSKFMSNPLPLNRTESRLPSLEDMIEDEELKSSVVLRGHKYQMLEAITEALANRESLARLLALKKFAHEFLHGEQQQDLSALPSDAQFTFIDNLCLFIRQQLSKTVDYYRTLVDLEREDGLTVSPTSLSSEEVLPRSGLSIPAEAHGDKSIYVDLNSQPAPGQSIYEFMINGTHEYTVERWALISAALNILRLVVSTNSVKDMVWNEEIAQTLIRHVDFIAISYIASQKARAAGATESPFIQECSDNLLKSVFYFLSNLIVERDDLREKTLRLLWPNHYWTLVVLAGPKNLDQFCLLLQNHLTFLLSKDCVIKPEDHPVAGNVDDEGGDTFKNLKLDFFNMCLTQRQADNAKWPKTFLSSFPDLYAYLLTLVNQKLRNSSGVRKTKNRHATMVGRAIKAEAVSGEWFSLLQLKLLSLGEGHSVIMLSEHLMAQKTSSPPASFSRHLAKLPLDDFTALAEVSQTQKLATLLLALSEYASSPEDFQDQILTASMKKGESKLATASGDVKDRSEQIFGRKWNMIRRAFVKPNVLQFLIDLLKSALKNTSARDVGSLGRQEEVDQTGGEYSELIRPCIKSLGSILASPEIRDSLNKDSLIELWDICWQLLEFTAPDIAVYIQLQKSQANAAQAGAGPEAALKRTGSITGTLNDIYDEAVTKDSDYVRKSNVYSCRDVLIVVAAIATNVPELCGSDSMSAARLKALLSFDQIQDQDIGAREASILALKIITEKSPVAVEVIKEIRRGSLNTSSSSSGSTAHI